MLEDHQIAQAIRVKIARSKRRGRRRSRIWIVRGAIGGRGGAGVEVRTVATYVTYEKRLA